MSGISDLCPDTAGEGMKSSWPELVGKRGEEAKEIIERENTKVTANIIPENAIVLGVLRCDNVYVRVDDYGIVTETPSIG
ncbi:Proteinase inhibitor [Cardamine amara subsp. amara]|uniref:Proteinase inhibitor n=1 Tax=Cardamine amara subsp. amara TaxID=228776 RepID=A0ABD0Z9D6_CARAN